MKTESKDETNKTKNRYIGYTKKKKNLKNKVPFAFFFATLYIGYKKITILRHLKRADILHDNNWHY